MGVCCVRACACVVACGVRTIALPHHQDLQTQNTTQIQGETDVGRPDYYECAFPRMIRNWRRLLKNSHVEAAEGEEPAAAAGTGPMPFGFVQLSS